MPAQDGVWVMKEGKGAPTVPFDYQKLKSKASTASKDILQLILENYYIA